MVEISLFMVLQVLYKYFTLHTSCKDHSGVVVEHRTPNREVLGLIPTGGTVLCP